MPVRIERHKQRGVANKGLRVYCPNAEHPGCSRDRSIHLWEEHFGAIAAEKYLELWLSRSTPMTFQQHREWRPSLRELRQYIG